MTRNSGLTGGLVRIVEQNEANYPHYCDTTRPYGCPAGHDKYSGRRPRGPVVLEHPERARHHDAARRHGQRRRFGETIRALNGTLECNGGNPGQVRSRIDNYQRFTQILGV